MSRASASPATTLTDSGNGRFALAGEIGFGTVTRLFDQGEDAFAAHAMIEVDLAGVTRCDSAAIALLLEWVRITELRGARLAFRDLPKALVAIASISDADELLPRAV